MNQLCFVIDPRLDILTPAAGRRHDAAHNFGIGRILFEPLAKPIMPHLRSTSPHEFIFAQRTNIAACDVAHSRGP